MTTKRWIHDCRVASLIVISLGFAAAPVRAGQEAMSAKDRAQAVEAFKAFSIRVVKYITLQQTVEATLPAMNPTSSPEVITARQQALASKIREARPNAKQGDLFTDAVIEAFRHASRAALAGPHEANSRAYMDTEVPSPTMRLVVNGTYSDTQPDVALSPQLLAAFPLLPADVAYRVVGRTLILMDVRSRLIIDVAPLVLPPG